MPGDRVNPANGGDLRQIILGILAAIASIAVVFGSLLIAFAQSGVGQAFIRTPQVTATYTKIPLLTPLVTPRPGQLTPTLSPTTAPPTETSACPLPPDWMAITVQSGDTLESLAQTYNVTIQQLKDANCLLTDRIQTGILIYVPAPATSPPPPEATDTLQPSRTPILCGPPAGWISYRVQAGDTLYSLATSTGTTVPTVQFANCLGSSTRIQVGQILYLPQQPPTKTAPPTQTQTATPTAPATATRTATSPVIASATSTATATETSSPTATQTSTATLTLTPTPTASATPTLTDTP